MVHYCWYWSVQLFNYTIQSLYLRAESCSPCFCLLFLFWPPQFLIPPNSKLQNWHTWIPGYRLFSILPLPRHITSRSLIVKTKSVLHTYKHPQVHTESTHCEKIQRMSINQSDSGSIKVELNSQFHVLAVSVTVSEVSEVLAFRCHSM